MLEARPLFIFASVDAHAGSRNDFCHLKSPECPAKTDRQACYAFPDEQRHSCQKIDSSIHSGFARLGRSRPHQAFALVDLCALKEMCFNAFVNRGASSFNSFAWSSASRPRTSLPLRVTRNIARLLSSTSTVRSRNPSRSERSTSSTALLCFSPSRSAAYEIVTAVFLGAPAT